MSVQTRVPSLTMIDGELATHIPVTDRGLQYGDGLFETIRVVSCRPLFYEAHLERLRQSCQRLAMPVNLSQLHDHVQSLLGRLPAGSHAILKLIITRGDGGRGYTPPADSRVRLILQVHPLPDGLEETARLGIDCMMSVQPASQNVSLAGMKHLNRLDQVLASQELAEIGRQFPEIREALMPDAQGHVVEGTRSNVFAVMDGVLCTPSLQLTGINGVLRHYLLEQAAEQGMQACICSIDSNRLVLASEVFICNSVIGVWPVRRLWSANAEKLLATYVQGPVTHWAQQAFRHCLTPNG